MTPQRKDAHVWGLEHDILGNTSVANGVLDHNQQESPALQAQSLRLPRTR